ncbi:sigma-54 dependent transcriptional regulator [Halodesulfovibrio sp.]|uniref:sigma-54-dependent transcriptional regulator n=1 Tax=Halodesulfovibrio sp. TaxID=1912772 RepID=UPI0025C4357A|nr:sigma-54 dependent transcriptional regulator [Halodesulfovibrio sp.]
MAKILVIDDELLIRTMLSEVIRSLGHEVVVEEMLQQGLASAKQTCFDVIYLDVLLPDGNGLEYIKDIRAASSCPELIIMTGHATPDDAEQAVRHGVWEYLRKPFTVEHIVRSLTRVLAFREQKRQQMKSALKRDAIVGSSPALMQALDLVAQAASSSVNTLLQGKTGTGKELFSQAIHDNSTRSNKPFVALDCASFTETLLESHLFGHKRGAFTGATSDREGVLQAADGGTLFLDEIGELPMQQQSAFLRVLETKRFRPIGSTKEITSDFRLIAATNKDLREMVRLGLFREDLLYRLRGLTITLPPLCERKEDLPALVSWWLDKRAEEHDEPCKIASDDFIETIMAYDWPGNVREFIHSMDRACTTVGGESVLYSTHLPVEMRVSVARAETNRQLGSKLPSSFDENAAQMASVSPVVDQKSGGQAHFVPQSLKEHRLAKEKEYIEGLLEYTQGDIKEAYKLAGVSRGHLYELMKKHNCSK